MHKYTLAQYGLSGKSACRSHVTLGRLCISAQGHRVQKYTSSQSETDYHHNEKLILVISQKSKVRHRSR